MGPLGLFLFAPCVIDSEHVVCLRPPDRRAGTWLGSMQPRPDLTDLSDSFPGEAIPAAVPVPSHLYHDPQPAAGRRPQGGGHDEEELLRVSISQGQQGEEFEVTSLQGRRWSKAGKRWATGGQLVEGEGYSRLGLETCFTASPGFFPGP